MLPFTLLGHMHSFCDTHLYVGNRVTFKNLMFFFLNKSYLFINICHIKVAFWITREMCKQQSWTKNYQSIQSKHSSAVSSCHALLYQNWSIFSMVNHIDFFNNIFIIEHYFVLLIHFCYQRKFEFSGDCCISTDFRESEELLRQWAALNKAIQDDWIKHQQVICQIFLLAWRFLGLSGVFHVK